MFTGLIEEVGRLKKIGRDLIEISCRKILSDAKVGDSISVNGLCLSIVKIFPDALAFHVSPTTVRNSRFSPGQMRAGEAVNLERALTVNSRLGGHIVSGHVDGTAKIISIKKQGKDYFFEFLHPKDLKYFIVPKGSVCIDGISLTISAVMSSSFEATIIPQTFNSTNLKDKKPYDNVHIEADIFARYIHHILLKGGIDEKDREIAERFCTR
jgi:riboflavin synthase